jgi:CheY-like chemotaxis protein
MADETRLCILLVEDHDDALRVMAILLQRSGYDVQAARNYDEAIRLVASGRCDLLISDVVLEGQSGLDLIRDLKLRNNLKSIAISSHVGPDRAADALGAGFDRFIPKPFDFNQLLRVIEELAGTSTK